MRNYKGFTKEGKWVYGSYLKDGKEHYIFLQERKCSFLGAFIKVIPETVRQQVGLKDKDGKKIYEDSIVTVYFGDLPSTLTAIAQIIYLENECRFVAKGIGKDKGKGPWTIDPKRIEIIGNIHQNPELMKQ